MDLVSLLSREREKRKSIMTSLRSPLRVMGYCLPQIIHAGIHCFKEQQAACHEIRVNIQKYFKYLLSEKFVNRKGVKRPFNSG